MRKKYNKNTMKKDSKRRLNNLRFNKKERIKMNSCIKNNNNNNNNSNNNNNNSNRNRNKLTIKALTMLV